MRKPEKNKMKMKKIGTWSGQQKSESCNFLSILFFHLFCLKKIIKDLPRKKKLQYSIWTIAGWIFIDFFFQLGNHFFSPHVSQLSDRFSSNSSWQILRLSPRNVPLDKRLSLGSCTQHRQLFTVLHRTIKKTTGVCHDKVSLQNQKRQHFPRVGCLAQ